MWYPPDDEHKYMHLAKCTVLYNIIRMPCRYGETFPPMSHQDVPTPQEVTRARRVNANTGCHGAIKAGEGLISLTRIAVHT